MAHRFRGTFTLEPMSTRAATLAFAVLALTIPAGRGLHAQSSAPASVGERVRVTTPSQRGGSRYVGSVVAVRPDTLVLQTSGPTALRPVPIDDIAALEVSTGRRGNTGRGILYGSVVGAGLGVVLGAATYEKPDCAGATWFCDAAPHRTATAVAGGVVGALAGLVVGGLWGATHPSDRWVRRSLGSGTRVGVMPVRNGAAVSLSARF